ncbi:MAG: AAA family ATPase [Oceanicaulis sp.]|nr:AAA family ATPase [Oceanicaulis sp.]
MTPQEMNRQTDEAQRLADELAERRMRTHDDDLPPPDAYEATSNEGHSPPAFALVRVSDMEFRAPAFVVRDYLEADTLALLFGDPGCGKSFQAVEVACCIATGTDWYGKPTKQGAAIYVAGEGRNGLKRRFRAWEIRHQHSLDDAPLYVSTMAAAMCDPVAAATVRAAVDEVAAAHGPPAVVVVDTLARNFGPGDENSTQDMTAFIAAADAIRTRYGCTVLLVHHTGHADKTRARGAMALKGALDAEYRMDKDESGVVRFEGTKMKDAPIPEPMAFRLCPVELGIQDDEGREVTSAVLEPTSYEPPPKAGKQGRGKWQTVALEQLQRLCREHRQRVEDSGRDPEVARVSVEDWRTACMGADMRRTSFYRVKDTLAAQGLIEIEQGFVR